MHILFNVEKGGCFRVYRIVIGYLIGGSFSWWYFPNVPIQFVVLNNWSFSIFVCIVAVQQWSSLLTYSINSFICYQDLAYRCLFMLGAAFVFLPSWPNRSLLFPHSEGQWFHCCWGRAVLDVTLLVFRHHNIVGMSLWGVNLKWACKSHFSFTSGF